MSATASPNPNNMILLAVLGIGAYWLMTRRAVAGPVAARPGVAPGATNTSAKIGAIQAGLNALGSIFGSPAVGINTKTDYYTGKLSPGQYQAASNAANRDDNPDLNGTVADWATSNTDGLAANPPGNVSAYDQWATDAVYWN